MAIKTYGVHDQWTDLNKINNVEIESVNGVIDSVKINGEDHGGGGGGGGDYTTATLTIVVNGEEADISGVYGPLLEEYNDELISVFHQNQTEQTTEYTVILLNGKAIISPIIEAAGSKTLSENITSLDDHDNYLMTGDATITYDDI